MAIKDIPETQDAFEAFNRQYEREKFEYTPAGRRVAEATREMFLNWFLPRPLHFLGYPAVYALVDDALLEAFHFPKPSRTVRALVLSGLRQRSRVVRQLPERRSPRLRTEMPHRTYPSGYEVARLGPATAPDWAGPTLPETAGARTDSGE
jgi:hypothetical protein